MYLYIHGMCTMYIWLKFQLYIINKENCQIGPGAINRKKKICSIKKTKHIFSLTSKYSHSGYKCVNMWLVYNFYVLS